MPKNAIAIESTVDVTAPEVTSVCADMEIEALFKRLTEQENIIGKKSDIIESQKKRIVLLEEYLRLERARRFGPSS